MEHVLAAATGDAGGGCVRGDRDGDGADDHAVHDGCGAGLFDGLALEGSSGADVECHIQYPSELLLELLSVPDLGAGGGGCGGGGGGGAGGAAVEQRATVGAATAMAGAATAPTAMGVAVTAMGGEATAVGREETAMGGDAMAMAGGDAMAMAADSMAADSMAAAGGRSGEQRSRRRREFHKIHTRRSRAKLNEKMERLRRVLPAPPPGVALKSKAQIIEHAIAVVARMQRGDVGTWPARVGEERRQP